MSPAETSIGWNFTGVSHYPSESRSEPAGSGPGSHLRWPQIGRDVGLNCVAQQRSRVHWRDPRSVHRDGQGVADEVRVGSPAVRPLGSACGTCRSTLPAGQALPKRRRARVRSPGIPRPGRAAREPDAGTTGNFLHRRGGQSPRYGEASMAGQVFMTTSRPTAVARSAAASSITPS